jgi:hypothetical protein
MLMPIEYRQFVLKMQRPRGARTGRRPRLREFADTLVLGGLSTAIGVVLLIALASGVIRRPIPGWNERAISASALYYIPSKDCAILSCIGVVLGLAGLMLAHYRHKSASPLSILGTAVSALHVYLFFLHVSVMEYL